MRESDPCLVWQVVSAHRPPRKLYSVLVRPVPCLEVKQGRIAVSIAVPVIERRGFFVVEADCLFEFEAGFHCRLDANIAQLFQTGTGRNELAENDDGSPP